MAWDNFRFTQMVEACEPRTIPAEVEDDTLRPSRTMYCDACETNNHPEAVDLIDSYGWLCPHCHADHEWE